MEDWQNIGKTSVKNLRSIGETSVKARKSIGVELNATQKSIIDLLSENVQMSGTELAERIGISKRNIETNIKKLKEKGILVRHGSARAGYWEICI